MKNHVKPFGRFVNEKYSLEREDDAAAELISRLENDPTFRRQSEWRNECFKLKAIHKRLEELSENNIVDVQAPDFDVNSFKNDHVNDTVNELGYLISKLIALENSVK